MRNRFADAVRESENQTYSENGAEMYKSTQSALLDFFFKCGAARSRTDEEIINMFELAYAENPLLAMKIVFYNRDIREGNGERRVSRVLYHHIADAHPEALWGNLKLIPEYGRWDDMYALDGTELEHDAYGLMKAQFSKDLACMRNNKAVSLLAKWLVSVDSPSQRKKPKDQRLGLKTALAFGYGGHSAYNNNLSIRDYKRDYRSLRKYIDVTERKMSANKWNQINYSTVPSKAMNNYSNAFQRHDPNGFTKYLGDVQKGKTKINSSTLYPYDITEKLLGYKGCVSKTDRATLNAQWDALPNYVEPNTNAMVMADTSGSMIGRPLASAVGLAIYFAQHNTGAYHGLWMNFSSKPSYQAIKGDKVSTIIENINRKNWQNSTNLEMAFSLILKTAKLNKISQDEMPKALIVISDMEFDRAVSDTADGHRYYSPSRDWGFYNEMKKKFIRAGYEIPTVIFWNVNSRNDTLPIGRADTEGVLLVSGHSTNTFKGLMNSVGKTPYDKMIEVLNRPRYDAVQIVD